MKAKALATCEGHGVIPSKHWKEGPHNNAVPAKPLIRIMWGWEQVGVLCLADSRSSAVGPALPPNDQMSEELGPIRWNLC